MSKSAFEDFAAKFKAREVTFTSKSGRVFVLRELSGAEQRVVDGAVKDFGAIEIAYKRLAASLVSIDGTTIPEITEPKDFDRVLELISGSELDQLLGEYGQAFVPRGEELKNARGDPESEGSLTQP